MTYKACNESLLHKVHYLRYGVINLMSNIKLHTISLTCFLLLVAVTGLMSHTVLPTDLQQRQNHCLQTAPPPGPVRPVAEFEPCSAVLIRYPLGIPVNLVSMLANEVEVICLVDNAYQQGRATDTFSAAGVNMDKVSFFVAPTDSYWTRDYSPWFIVDGNDDFAAVDFVYNRPRPADNQIPQLFAQNYSYPYYAMSLQQTGGNYMTDGISIAAQTTLVYNENPGVGQTGVHNIMLQYMGAHTFYGIPDPNNTYIDHIDCWGKFLAPNKVLVRSVPASHPQYNAIEQAAAYFATRNCSWGYPWKVYRVNTPQNQPYSNSLILNKKVFVPITNSSSDAAALQVYRDALPGYEVIGVPGAYNTPWESTDALHCRTHEINDRQMLYVSHFPLWGEHDAGQSFDIDVKIKAYSGQALYSDSLRVVYKVNSGIWQSELLNSLGGDQFSCSLSGFASGDTIRYFIHAADQSGRSIDHPFTGAHDPHLFVIYMDTQAPLIEHQIPVDVICSDSAPIAFVALITDDGEVGDVYFRYYTETQDVRTAPMNHMGYGLYCYNYSPDFGKDDHFLSYQIQAQDREDPPNVSVYPSENEWISIPLKTVGVDDPVIPGSDLANLRIYPNPIYPGDRTLRIESKNLGQDTYFWTIFNIRGQKLASGKSKAELKGGQLSTIDLNLLENNIVKPGIYLLKISGKFGEKSCKFIITN